ncbi:hypothetical protein DT603_09535 [Pseudoxanthomonas gei]|uniref:Secreted protein n=1 Tax=Pseudoxanthomonas gei TaxID=1383030 RepID=A0ABX0AC83_9GAMM|nr:hypothetical protein [Pseudoxanthomonas gei]NDK39081.1 hypothetical protein [Pseudoxanthomonas gei]
MKNITTKTAFLAVSASLLFALSGCKVEQTEEGKLPNVEVKADGGNLPKYDVETPEVSVGTKTVEVEVPTATVEMPNDPDNKVTDETDSSKK